MSSVSVATKPRVALGMSGGVDSSVAAHLLTQQGYDVTGVFLECWRAPGCRTDQDRQDALKVALGLGLPFQVLDFKDAYREKVVEDFIREYQAGRTPNPDTLCNKEIKFGLFYNWAMSQGFEYVATGHYAALHQTEVGVTLAVPADHHKDQTYFLYLLSETQLAHTIFPLQHLNKQEVRALAHQLQLPTADKKDSVGICFIGDIDVRKFLKEQLGTNPGPVVTTRGEVIGRHQGLWFYTIGQRHGFEIDKKTLITLESGAQFERENIPPFYVVRKDPEQNQLVVGFGVETMSQVFEVSQLHWIHSRLSPLQSTEVVDENVLVRIRHTGDLLPVVLSKLTSDRVKAELTQPIKGLAAGQAAVFYSQISGVTVCLGGGVIELPPR